MYGLHISAVHCKYSLSLLHHDFLIEAHLPVPCGLGYILKVGGETHTLKAKKHVTSIVGVLLNFTFIVQVLNLEVDQELGLVRYQCHLLDVGHMFSCLRNNHLGRLQETSEEMKSLLLNHPVFSQMRMAVILLIPSSISGRAQYF